MTETTTQPDPQVVAWMREYLQKNPSRVHVGDLVHAYRRTLGAIEPDWDALYDAEEAARVAAARKPLTVADIPRGQGAASLFIAPADVLGYTDGNAALWIQTEDGPLFIRWAAGPGDSPADRALWALIEAHVPTIDTTEEST